VRDGTGGGTYVGVSPYGTLTGEPASSGLKLGSYGGCDGSTTACANQSAPELYELNSSWTPRWAASSTHYWKMNGNWNDSVGSLTGTPTNGASFSPSAPLGSHAGIFDGTDDFTALGTGDPITTSSFTISAWVYNTAQAAGQNDPILTKWDATSNKRAFLLFSNYTNSGNVACGVSTSGVNVKIGYTATSTLPLNTWTHVACTYSAGTYKIYINGVSKAVSTASSGAAVTTAPFSTDSAVRIGSAVTISGAVRYFHGSLDEIATWSVALTPEEVLKIYARQ